MEDSICSVSSDKIHKWEPCTWENVGGGNHSLEYDRESRNWPVRTEVTQVYCIYCLTKKPL